VSSAARPQVTAEEALRGAADLFHEVLSGLSAEDLIVNCRNEVLREKLREDLRTRDQLKAIAASGFELCVTALAALGASGVTIHECSKSDMEPWDE
jgi:hypothetical protein